jgi:hypothetical protein
VVLEEAFLPELRSPLLADSTEAAAGLALPQALHVACYQLELGVVIGGA